MEVKELKPGDVLGRYQLLLPIAKGGMGQVWAARLSGTRGFQKLVAVKTILPSPEDGPNLEAMLFEEASLASQIRHPNVAETLDLGERDDGTLYLVMEWVNGEPLDYIVRAARPLGGIPIAIAVHLIIQALKGLHAAHVATSSNGEPLGIVHRDISPQNLLVTYDGVVKLVDFGVAKATHQMSAPTAVGQVKGKFAYMSPEQVHGDPIDARADVFAMGIVLYRVTTGLHPFKSDNPAATVRNILSRDPALPSQINPSYPKALEEIVMKALARDKRERFNSAEEMMLELEKALPDAVANGSDKNSDVFLKSLLAKRIAERTEALAAAMNSADAVPLAMPQKQHPRSQSTMRAVSIGLIDVDVEEASREAEEGRSVSRGRRIGGAVTVLAASAAALVVVSAVRRPNETPAAATPSPVVSAPKVEAPAVTTPGEPKPVPAPPESEPAPLPSLSASQPGANLKKRNLRRADGSVASVASAFPAPTAVSGSPVPAAVSGRLEEVDPLNRRK